MSAVVLLCAAAAGDDGRRLSKRDRDLDLGELRKRYTLEQIIGKLAVLTGLIPEGETASVKDLILLFPGNASPRSTLF